MQRELKECKTITTVPGPQKGYRSALQLNKGLQLCLVLKVWAPAIPIQGALGGGPTDAEECLPFAPPPRPTQQALSRPCHALSIRIRGGLVYLVPKMKEQAPRGHHHWVTKAATRPSLSGSKTRPGQGPPAASWVWNSGQSPPGRASLPTKLHGTSPLLPECPCLWSSRWPGGPDVRAREEAVDTRLATRPTLFS